MRETTTLEQQARDILGPRYRVRPCTKATSEAAKRGDHRKLYAVWTGKGIKLRRITDPMPHQDAQQQRMVLVVQDILDLVGA
jgi:hypothetical protein